MQKPELLPAALLMLRAAASGSSWLLLLITWWRTAFRAKVGYGNTECARHQRQATVNVK